MCFIVQWTVDLILNVLVYVARRSSLCMTSAEKVTLINKTESQHFKYNSGGVIGREQLNLVPPDLGTLLVNFVRSGIPLSVL